MFTKKNVFHCLLYSSCVFSSLLFCSFSRPNTVIEEAPEISSEADVAIKNEGSNITEPVTNYKHDDISGEKISLKESWGYVMAGREYEFNNDMPITDVGYFSAGVNVYGELEPAPSRSKFSTYSGRVHLVTSCDSKSLTHFILDPSYPVKDKLVKSLVAASESYDGLQVDYELVPARDGKNFLNFLKDLRKQLSSEKMLTVALPARTRTIADDVYGYEAIAAVVDKIIVMAYDEHWSTSAPGSIASIDWCEKIAKYCVTVIPPEKLVMGLPFYGRTWGNVSANRAWYFSGINRIMNENENPEVYRDNSVPYFKYKTEMTVTGYFEDAISLVARTRMYSGLGINRLAYWRIGQEDTTYWNWLEISE